MSWNRWPILAAAAAVGVWAAGCGASSEGTQAAETTDGDATQTAGAEIVPDGEAQLGDRTRCPVSGEEFIVTAESPHVEHEGKTYYFCCPDCIQRFEADPAQYTQPADDMDAEPPAGPVHADAPPSWCLADTAHRT